MHRRHGKLIVAATDLVGFLECGHLTRLDRAAAAGLVHKPTRSDDPVVELLRWRGGRHEERSIELLRADGRVITDLSSNRDLSYDEQADRTAEAMRRGDDVIYQGTVFDGRWIGYPDFLLRKPSAADSGAGGPLGIDYHYEVADTKLAHSAKASALIQICSYVEQITNIQGKQPENIHVVTGGAEAKPHEFRTAEMMAYYRHAKKHFEDALDEAIVGPAAYPIDRAVSYPAPVEHCAVCKWFYEYCRQQWREDDALPMVAGISRKQRETLRANEVVTMTALSELAPPIQLEGMKVRQAESMLKMREQARLQVDSQRAGVVKWELLEAERDSAGVLVSDRGLSALPEPSEDDLFFDIEGDPFAFWEGLEYLFGIWDGVEYRSFWALNRDEEKHAFKDAMDLFYERWKQHPEMHVYHYGAYEPSRLKHLAGRHATRQDQLDELLRGRVFVDLLRVVRQGVRVGVESYSIKRLEPLYGFTREIELRDANSSIVEFEKILEIGDPGDELKASILAYNADDCRSTHGLRDWLEQRRLEAARQFGIELPRPRLDDESTEKKPPTEWDVRLRAAVARLTAEIPPDPADQTELHKQTWLLANLLDFHRREEKASWWRFFELIGMSGAELFEEQEPIAGLQPQGVVDVRESQKKVYRYSFPAQEHKVGNRSELYDPRLPLFKEAQVENGGIDKDALTIDLVRPADWTGPDPTALVPYDRIPIDGLQVALARIGEWVAEHGLDSEEVEYRAVRDLIRGMAPRVVGLAFGEPLYDDGEGGSAAAKRLACSLDATTLAIQGPPGSGKTHNGARMIVELVRNGRRVGITGSSHKVVTNLLGEVWEAARKDGLALEALQKIDREDGEERPWMTVKDNGRLDRLLVSEERDFRVVAGTVWLWAREKMTASIDTLFVDEAGQVALANVVAAGRATRNVVLLGDPQQLDQVLQGSHPPGAEQSALGHFLGEAETLARDRGVFLEKTWRMHPQITVYTSELFYEDKLKPIDGLERQIIAGTDDWSGSGLRWVEVVHDENTNASPEEAKKVVEIVSALVGREWTDRLGDRRVIWPTDIRIVSPYNAHRLLIDEMLGRAGLRGVPVGTVDKFQGQEAPVSIYTMATSRPEDAPRGMKFLYSLNRLNVATSRARALAIIVASPRLLSVIPRTPQQLRMANGICAFVDAAVPARATGAEPEGSPRQLALQLLKE